MAAERRRRVLIGSEAARGCQAAVNQVETPSSSLDAVRNPKLRFCGSNPCDTIAAVLRPALSVSRALVERAHGCRWAADGRRWRSSAADDTFSQPYFVEGLNTYSNHGSGSALRRVTRRLRLLPNDAARCWCNERKAKSKIIARRIASQRASGTIAHKRRNAARAASQPRALQRRCTITQRNAKKLHRRRARDERLNHTG